ncbi:hypothetical protein HNQ77_002340 [Silvibacterium bohemicum]|uniref:Uncharacterized protein n=1 Tax=Silvibacterium bohemicum TaxID=1577686 RepID=A0A841K157_9BACT|nr:hypothetical protein [Silvibacterium bohemicum]MBB6144388.1 hypothetical protein [Silvibacterium bohemicum]
MLYTKAHVLSTVNANKAIQSTGNHPHGKRLMILDNVGAGDKSTTGAYEADE